MPSQTVQSPAGDIFEFSVLVRVVDETALTETAESLVEGCSEWPLEERVEFAVVNPANPPLECGYELQSISVRERLVGNPLIDARTFVVTVAALVHDEEDLEREAIARWRGSSKSPSIATPVDQLYEILVVSNGEMPAGWCRRNRDGLLMPKKRGFEVFDYQPKVEVAPQAEDSDDGALPAPGM